MKLSIFYDVSGAIDDDQMNKYLFEAEWRKAMFPHTECHEYCFANGVLSLDDYLNEDILCAVEEHTRFINDGSGGIDVDYLWHCLAEAAEDGNAVIILTDGNMPPMKLVPGHGPFEIVNVR